MAKQLATAGLKCVLLERGGWHDYEESTNDESSHATKNDYVNESINRILKYSEEDSPEFIFQLEDSYRKQSVPLNKIRQQ